MGKIKFLIVFVLLGSLIWYFAIKDYNYRVTFKTPQVPGIVYDHIIKWNNGEGVNNKVVTVLNQSPFFEIEQELIVGDSIFKIRWTLEKENDSTTLVIAKFKDVKHSFMQNLQVPFYKNAFVKRSISTVKKFGENLLQNAKNYKVSEVTKDKIPSQYCAFISLESKPQDKASTMVKNIYIVMNYIKDNNIKLTGNPFLEITEWDVVKDIIKFNFCFPIEERGQYPTTNDVKFKKIKEKFALKTSFNGNYKISDRAWYVIMDYAQTKKIDIDKLPVEVFFNDPHDGGNDLEWKAEVYMPIKNKAQ
ncbi:MAG: hypothetical protein KAJ28_01475 [Flavobacteriaceae bacterium]|nr:hypothetical protein [Flavobacteriaceae bacterium]